MFRKLTLSFFALVSISSASAQVADFFRYHQATAQEKLFITTDRPYYQAGDTIWFRGTLATADRLSYVVKSNYIIVELLNAADCIVMRRKVLREGLCFDHCLPLPGELRTGEYTLRAYTTWMQNFPTDFLFSRKLTVVNPAEPASEDVRINPDFALQFFPEGGSFLAGQTQNVAFKAEGNNGFPMPVRMVIRDADGRDILSLRSSHDGMGSFRIPAASGLSAVVTALISPDYDQPLLDTLQQPVSHVVPLPEPQSAGFAIEVTAQDASTLSWRILAAGPVSDSLTLLLHAGARVVAVQRVMPGEGTLDISNTREGISHLMLLDAAGCPVSRRLIFHRIPDKATGGEIRMSWNARDPKGYCAVNLHLQDAGGRPLRGDFAISVTDCGYVNPDYDPWSDNIVSALLLTSDLRGYIHNPAWYFSDAPGTTAALDLVMLTHGWCRFRTDSLVYNPDRVFEFPLEEKEYVTGQVTHLPKNLKNPMISIVDTVSNTFGSARLDDDNRFFVGGLNFPDQALLNLRLTGKRTIMPEFTFDPEVFPEASHREPFRVDFASYVRNQAERELFVGRDGMRTVMLDNIVVTDQRKSKSPFFKGIATERYRDAEYLADNYDLHEYNDALQLINQVIESEWSMRLSRLEETSDEAGSWNQSEETSVANAFVTNNATTMSWGKWGTFVINDEHYDNPFSAIGVLRRIRSRDVARIEIIDQMQNAIEPFSGKVVLNVFLKEGAVIQSGSLDGRFATFRRFGYTPARDFYNPVYATPEQRLAPLFPDLRKTLRWIPSLQTGADGNTRFDFYNSDHTGPRQITVSGLTFDGRPVHVVRIIDK